MVARKAGAVPAASSSKPLHTSSDGSDLTVSIGDGDVTTVTRPTDPETGANGWHGHNPRRQGFGNHDGPADELGEDPEVPAPNQAPIIGGVPMETLVVDAGQTVALPDFTVDDPEDGILNVMVHAGGGVINGLPIHPEWGDAGFYTLSGTEAEINAQLADATFTATGDGPNTIDIYASDASSATAYANMIVTVNNQAPTIGGLTGGTLSAPVGQATALPDITVDDPEDRILTVRVSATNGVVNGLPHNPLYDPDAPFYEVTGTEAEVNAALAAATFTARDATPGYIEITATDGSAYSAPSYIQFMGTNEAPVIGGLPSEALTVSIGQTVALPDITVDDPEDGTLRVTVYASAGEINGLSAGQYGGYEITGTEADINAQLAAATYTATQEGGNQIYVHVDDGSGIPTSVTIDVTVTNEAPTISGVPEEMLSMPIGQASALPDITVNDPEGGVLTVRVNAYGGVIDGLPHDPNYDPATPFYLLTGTAEEINAQLAAATYTPTEMTMGYVQVVASDGLNYSDAANISIMGTNETPVISGVPGEALIMRANQANALPDIVVDDPEDGILTVRVSTGSGVIDGLPPAAGYGNGNYYEVTGTEDEVNTLLANATFTPNGETWDYIDVQVLDQYGAGTATSLAVNSYDQRPTFGGLPESPIVGAVGTPTALPDITVDDPEDGILTVKVYTYGGTLSGLPELPNRWPGLSEYQLTGTEAEINALLGAATYTARQEGSDYINYIVEDSHGYTEYANFAVEATNEAPVIGGLPAGPVPVTVGQATALPGITVDDLEDGVLTVIVSVTGGTIAGLPEAPWSTPGSGVYQLTGTEADINAQLAAATYTASYEGPNWINVTASDGFESTWANVEVMGIDEAPVIDGLPEGLLSVPVGQTVELPDITVDDPENGVLTVDVTVYGGTMAGLPDAPWATPGSGSYQLVGTEDEVNALLAAATYTTDYEGQGDIVITAWDSAYHSTSASIHVMGVDLAPIIGGLPEGPLAVPVGLATALPDITVDDPENGLLTVEVWSNGGTIAGLPQPDWATPEMGIYRLTGSEAEINAQLAAATYTANYEGPGALSINVSDSTGHLSTAYVDILGTDEAPVVGLPASPLTLAVGEVAALSGITVDDPEDGSLTVELYAGSGIIHGLPEFDPNSSFGSYVLTGTESEINAMLADATFTTLDEGQGAIQVTVWDAGWHGSSSWLAVDATPEIVADETLYGTAEGELLSGGGGGDVLIGYAGDDLLVGGGGADLFMFASGAGNDRIADFNGYDGDRIVVATDLTYTIGSNPAGNALVSFSDGSSLTLRNVSEPQVSSSWFLAA